MEEPSSEEEEENLGVVVIDNGSCTISAGFCGEDSPSVQFPCVLGVPRQPIMLPNNGKGFYVGEEAQRRRGILQMSYPVEQKIITNWESMEKIWHYIFYNQLNRQPEDHPVLLTESTFNSRDNREKIVQIMFETFNAPATHIANSAVLSLYASGRTTGVVVDCGYSTCDIVPICDLTPLQHASTRFGLGGRHISDQLTQLLIDRGYRFACTGETDAVPEIKENLSYVAMNFDEELLDEESSILKIYEPHTAKFSVSIGTERFRCAEILFTPHIAGIKSDGIHQLVNRSVLECDGNLRKDLYGNIVISGGTSQTPRFGERLQTELEHVAPSNLVKGVKIIAPAERRYTAWLGGSIMAPVQSPLKNMWMTKDMYDEVGPSIVQKKFV